MLTIKLFCTVLRIRWATLLGLHSVLLMVNPEVTCCVVAIGWAMALLREKEAKGEKTAALSMAESS